VDIYEDCESLPLRLGFFSRAVVAVVVWVVEKAWKGR
jgi:hypothetical protein